MRVIDGVCLAPFRRGVLRDERKGVATMHYAVLIQRGKSKADDFAQAITTGRMEPASVFVIGITDTEAFASALLGETLEIDAEFEAGLALKVKYSEAIGTEDEGTPLADLVEHAKKRIAQITAEGSTRRLADPFAAALRGRRS